MPLRMLKIADVTPFAYAFEGNIKARMADIGRRIGSKTIGLAIQTVAPGCLSSRRHKHVFQEEILIVMSGTGLLHHAAERFAVGPVVAGRRLPVGGLSLHEQIRARTLGSRHASLLAASGEERL
jgi:hypothetical protein